MRRRIEALEQLQRGLMLAEGEAAARVADGGFDARGLVQRREFSVGGRLQRLRLGVIRLEREQLAEFLDRSASRRAGGGPATAAVPAPRPTARRRSRACAPRLRCASFSSMAALTVAASATVRSCCGSSAAALAQQPHRGVEIAACRSAPSLPRAWLPPLARGLRRRHGRRPPARDDGAPRLRAHRWRSASRPCSRDRSRPRTRRASGAHRSRRACDRGSARSRAAACSLRTCSRSGARSGAAASIASIAARRSRA